jgi:hypothetical protein
LFNELAHLAVFGTTRAGKSIILGDICFNACEVSVVAFDYPKETTGASTFTDLTNSLHKLGVCWVQQCRLLYQSNSTA